jgi:formamidopyrimidine-DNA glycosylase
MPELPEVETVVRGLNDQISGLRVKKIGRIAKHLLKREPQLRRIEKDTFESFARRGKYIIAQLKSGRRLLIHLRMSGQFRVVENGVRPDKHDHLEFIFTNSPKKLLFRDMRKFGVFEFFGKQHEDAVSLLGPEATSITSRALRERLQASRRPIKSLLLDQHVIAGLGNIYVDESLFRSGIHPQQPASAISPDEAGRLAKAIRYVMKQAIMNMGTTVINFSGVNGDSGRYAQRLKVYRRSGDRCHRCGTVIQRIKLGGRGTHFCPSCQKQ